MHYDHVSGPGELRTLSFLANRRLAVFGTQDVLDGLERSTLVTYSRQTRPDEAKLYKPSAKRVRPVYGEAFEAEGVYVVPFCQDHGICDSVGFWF